MGGWRYVGRKVLQAFFTLIFVLVFNFFLFRIMPGDPVRLLTRQRGIELSVEAQEGLRRDLGLDKGLPAQFVDYVGDLTRGELGLSFIYQGESVMDVFLRFLWPTVLLVGTATILMMVIGLYMGIRGGWSRGSRFDNGSMGVSLLFYSMPDFWLAMMLLIVFSTTLGWFPSGGYSTPNADLTGIAHIVDVMNHMFLPVITLTIAYVGEYYLVMRSSLVGRDGGGLHHDGPRQGDPREQGALAARGAERDAPDDLGDRALAGVRDRRRDRRGGRVLVPGLGLLTFQALDSQDFLMLQGLFLFFTLAILFSNLVADLLYSWFDPRVREA